MGRKLGLTSDDVLAAAMRVADKLGLAGTSLGAVAERLGVRTPSLYHWFPGTDGLRRMLALHGAQLLGDELRAAAVDREGGDALRAMAHAFRRFATRHPGVYEAFLPAPTRAADPELYDALAGPIAPIALALAQLGVASTRVVPVVRALRSLLHGFTALERGRGFGMPDDVDASFDAAVELLLAGITDEGARTSRTRR